MLDLDGDGKADTIFTDGTTGFGIKTATGAIITANPLLGGGGDHHAWAMTMDSEPPVAVVDDGHTASVFALVNCKLVTPKNPQGKRYTFTLEGFGPYGTGVTCAGSQRGGYILGGVNAVKSGHGCGRESEEFLECLDAGAMQLARQGGADVAEVPRFV